MTSKKLEKSQDDSSRKKLELNKETLKDLSARNRRADKVAGGVKNESQEGACTASYRPPC